MDETDDDHDRESPPAISRLKWDGERRYRMLSRGTARPRSRDRFPRLRTQLPAAELIGRLIKLRGLTDDVRLRCVAIYWPEIAGERIASKTLPLSFAAGVLHVSATTSSWVHELQFYKAQLIADTNRWVDANRVWLGAPPLVLDMRFALVMRQREPIVDREQVRRLQRYYARRAKLPTAGAAPPVASDADRDAIRAETSAIVDPELRGVIESVRLKWNR